MGDSTDHGFRWLSSNLQLEEIVVTPILLQHWMYMTLKRQLDMTVNNELLRG